MSRFHLRTTRRKKAVSILALIVGALVCALSAYAYFSAPSGSATKTGSISGPTSGGQSALVVSYPDGSSCFDASITSGASKTNLNAAGESIRCKLQVANPAGNATQNNVVVSGSFALDGAHSTCPAGSYVVTFGTANTSGSTSTVAGGSATYSIPSIAAGANFQLQEYVTFINLGASTNQDSCLGSSVTLSASAVGG
jgi:hypothetical protein